MGGNSQSHRSEKMEAVESSDTSQLPLPNGHELSRRVRSKGFVQGIRVRRQITRAAHALGPEARNLVGGELGHRLVKILSIFSELLYGDLVLGRLQLDPRAFGCVACRQAARRKGMWGWTPAAGIGILPTWAIRLLGF